MLPEVDRKSHQDVEKILCANHEGCGDGFISAETRVADEDVRRVRPPVRVAEEVGEGVGAGPLLLRPLPAAEGEAVATDSPSDH